MNASQPLHEDTEEALARVRNQVAIVRALLDEVDRVLPPDPDDVVKAQLVEELARLGCQFFEAASTLASEDERGPVAALARRSQHIVERSCGKLVALPAVHGKKRHA